MIKCNFRLYIAGMRTQDNPLAAALRMVGTAALARELGVSQQAIRKWLTGGRMPRTEWTGETAYCHTIERLTSGQVTRDQLLSKWPSSQQAA